MRLERISIKNFRLLRRFSIDLARGSPTTVLVGPNNSGKTSVMDALRLLIGGLTDAKKRPSFHDLCHARKRDFNHLQARIESIEKEEDRIALVRARAPRIRLDLIFSYDQSAGDTAVATELLMNLDPNDDRVGLRIEFGVDNAKALLNDFDKRRNKDQTLVQFLSDRIGRYYGFACFKISTDGKQADALESGNVVKRLIKIDAISAQRHVDDEESSRAAKLSKLLHDHYNSYYKAEDEEGFNEIEDAISASAANLTAKYEGAFERLVTRLKSFGYPQGHLSPDLRIRAEMNAETIYRDNTRIYYASELISAKGEKEEYELPEKYNGLGYKNLIYIVLQLESFRASLEAMTDERPRVHVIAIEEPEAHLHPQMQCVFIKEISKTVTASEAATPQVILSTHSSHIVANSEFDPIRYFKRRKNEVEVRDLSRLPMVTGEDVLRFLRRYVRLTHCDLFFADKTILVEGQVERLLLPIMLQKSIDRPKCAYLTSEYITISEVGGAYAHKLKPLVDFLGIPTLIITDIDAVRDDNTKCPVAEGTKTSNAALKEWLPGKTLIKELLAAEADAKTQGNIRVAYQVPENGQCGRSFEEAFIYANLDWLAANHGTLVATGQSIGKGVNEGLAAKAYDVSGGLPKVDFALDLITADTWTVPVYILEGLEWLGAQGAA